MRGVLELVPVQALVPDRASNQETFGQAGDQGLVRVLKLERFPELAPELVRETALVTAREIVPKLCREIAPETTDRGTAPELVLEIDLAIDREIVPVTGLGTVREPALVQTGGRIARRVSTTGINGTRGDRIITTRSSTIGTVTIGILTAGSTTTGGDTAPIPITTGGIPE